MSSRQDLAPMIEQTLLRPDATRAEVMEFLAQARKHKFFAAVVNPGWVALAAKEMAGTGTRIGTAIGFPLGATTSETKAREAAESIRLGAREIDVVINIGALKGGELDVVRDDLRRFVEACRNVSEAPSSEVTLKAILETCYLTDAEKERGVEAAIAAGCDFVKTSTGFGPRGATVSDVRLMARVAAGRAKVKAAGGIGTLQAALDLVEAGAERLGTSKGVQILAEQASLAAANE